MGRVGTTTNFADCLTVGEAAKFLGVSTATLRNWDRSGKLKPRRHPQNGYRIYLHEDLEAVLRSAELPSAIEDVSPPAVDWSQTRDTSHFVQFYESDDFLIESVHGYVSAALNRGDGAVVIATSEHRVALQRRLVAGGLDVAAAIEGGRYIVLDAADTLAKFMVEGMPDEARFKDAVGSVIAQVSNRATRRVHAFGEMVALLWSQGSRDAAIQLEKCWNNLAAHYQFTLYCAYPVSEFGGEANGLPCENDICDQHSHVMPSDNYLLRESEEERLRQVSALQRKAVLLTAEIEHRMQVEKSLAERERELVDFFENATEGLHKVGADGTILWANRAEMELLGYAPEEYIGQPIAQFHADCKTIEDILERLNRGETLRNYPARLRCKNGDIKHVLISSNVYFEEGVFRYTRCFTRDVSQQREAEQALRESLRRKDEFLATLSHELRSPLAPIMNGVEMLRIAKERRNEEILEDTRNIIERQARQMTRLVGDLLDISRISRDKIQLRKERAQLAAIIDAAVETSRPVIDEARHELTLTLPAKPVYVSADAARLAQVFANLLNNAAKYTEPGGQIYLQVKPASRHVIVTVRDTGIGIPCNELAHIFDMFRQADGSQERAQGGLGIGLTLVRRLVELHGGTVSAMSEGPGTGTEFRVELPLASAEVRQSRKSQVSEVRVSKKRILVVDDNADAGNTLASLLRLDGHEVRLAQNGVEAVEVATQFSPEVILMDVGMPKMNGYEATRQIRQLPGGDRIFIVALTGWGQESDKHNSADAGCSAHLVKPVEFTALQRLLANGSGGV